MATVEDLAKVFEKENVVKSKHYIAYKTWQKGWYIRELGKPGTITVVNTKKEARLYMGKLENEYPEPRVEGVSLFFSTWEDFIKWESEGGYYILGQSVYVNSTDGPLMGYYLRITTHPAYAVVYVPLP